MIASFPGLLAHARERNAAVGAFTCYDVTTAFGVLQAAEARHASTILLVSEASARAPYGALLIAALSSVADEASMPCCVQLDHASDPVLIERALDAGAGAAMADGSRLPTDENAALVSTVRGLADSHAAAVEAELGHIEGGEDVARATMAGGLTDPDEAAEFVAAVRPDCLAVSIGNVHGTYAAPPELDWNRLRRIRERVNGVPLSLHGASGLPDDDLRQAIELGVAKVNVNTEIREGYLDALERGLPEARRGWRVLELQTVLIDAVAEVVAAKLDLLEASR